MRRTLYVLAMIGCFLCLFGALFFYSPLCMGEPFRPWALMAGFALVALASGEGTGRFLALLALVIGLAGSIHAYEHNRRVIANMREMWRQGEIRRRQLVQQMGTNRLDGVQTNQVSQPDPKLSPFNCCP
ncbi:MAG: hypothetical protein ABSD58_06885 [Verrucomicrobiia bacterium]